ncbi:MAG: type II toxin-antitoxin system Phd/YefM family antitoxin [Phycisphaerae bacterium]
MKFVTVHEAKTHLSEIIARVERGEEITIKRGRDPVVRLIAIKERGRRRPGAFKGQIVIKPGAFDPLTADQQKLWEKKD